MPTDISGAYRLGIGRPLFGDRIDENWCFDTAGGNLRQKKSFRDFTPNFDVNKNLTSTRNII